MFKSGELLMTLVGCGILSVVTAVGQVARAEVIGLNPVADAFITSTTPDSNYGGAGAISVSAAGSAKGEFQSLLRFDGGAAKDNFDTLFGPGQWLVQSVSLRLTAGNPNNPIFNPSAAGEIAVSWMADDSWLEGTGNPSNPGSTGITFNSLTAFTSANDRALGQFSFTGATSGSAVYPLSMPSDFLTDLSAGNMVSLRLFAADSMVSGVFNSRNFGTVGNRPLLSISAAAVPEPASLLLLGMSIFCFRWSHRGTRHA